MKSTNDIPDDWGESDEFVWLWNSLETAWVRVNKWSVKAYRSTHPSRYPFWREGSEIETPEQLQTGAALQELADTGQTMDMWANVKVTGLPHGTDGSDAKAADCGRSG